MDNPYQWAFESLISITIAVSATVTAIAATRALNTWKRAHEPKKAHDISMSFLLKIDHMVNNLTLQRYKVTRGEKLDDETLNIHATLKRLAFQINLIFRDDSKVLEAVDLIIEKLNYFEFLVSIYSFSQNDSKGMLVIGNELALYHHAELSLVFDGMNFDDSNDYYTGQWKSLVEKLQQALEPYICLSIVD